MNYGLLNDLEISELSVYKIRKFDQEKFDQLMNEPWACPLEQNAARRAYKEREATIRDLCTSSMTPEEFEAQDVMIEPFEQEQIKRKSYVGADGQREEAKLLSYGLSSFGYDVSLADEFWIFVPSYKNFLMWLLRKPNVVDPKRPDPKNLKKVKVQYDDDGCKYVVMPPNSYGMGYTKEYFKMPRDVNAVCVGKSTYARSTIEVNVTPIEAGFHGQVVIELANGSHCPARVYLEEGIAQFQFHRGRPSSVSYADRSGKYQGQTGLTVSRV